MKLSRNLHSPRFDLFSEFDSLFQRAFGPPQANRSAASGFDLYESDDAWVLRADLPGFEKKDIDVSLAEGAITVHARREDDDRSFYSEVRQSFRLPDDVNVKGIEARLDHGIFELVLPKSEEAQPESLKIEVN